MACFKLSSTNTAYITNDCLFRYKPHPDFIINELNINSAISHPNHGTHTPHLIPFLLVCTPRLIPPAHEQEHDTNFAMNCHNAFSVSFTVSLSPSLTLSRTGEVLELKGNKPYLLQGYCYSGGGRKVIRCEITFDNVRSLSLSHVYIHTYTH
jgi:hypothetical protein